ncbi:hypothetical protein [Moorena sp. SIO3B2]|nr:hypothetical protein [Moorena sp. SIO3B2]
MPARLPPTPHSPVYDVRKHRDHKAEVMGNPLPITHYPNDF